MPSPRPGETGKQRGGELTALPPSFLKSPRRKGDILRDVFGRDVTKPTQELTSDDSDSLNSIR